MEDTAPSTTPQQPVAPISAARLRTLILFGVSLSAAAVAIILIGWFTSLKEAMHTALLAVAVFAFLPLVIVAVGVGLASGLLMLQLMIGLIAAVFGGGGEEIDFEGPLELASDSTALGRDVAPGYYGWLARQRHPVFWGVPAGVLIGGLLLWGLVALFILPGETRTAQLLATLQQDIERYYQ